MASAGSTVSEAVPESALRADVLACLARVPDPEIPVVSIVDLGIVHDVRIGDSGLQVDLLPTYTACPATEVIERDVRRALSDAGFGEVTVRRCLAPAWTTDLITVEGRDKLAAFGIAPPARLSQVARNAASDRPAACPQCGSANTIKVSEFGSTPCKSAWRCSDCREPFDYFKCL